MERTKRKILRIAASFLTAMTVFVTGLLSGCAEQGADDSAPTPDGAEIHMQDASDGVSLRMEQILSEDYGEYGISPLAVGSYRITATAKMENGSPCSTEYQSFAFPTLTYESGESVSSSTMTVSQQSKNTFLLTCNTSFSKRIIFSVMSTVNAAKKAKLFIDYSRSVSSYLLNNGAFGNTWWVDSNFSEKLNIAGLVNTYSSSQWSTTKILEFPDIAEGFKYGTQGTMDDEVIWYRLEGKFSSMTVDDLNNNFRSYTLKSDWTVLYESDSGANNYITQYDMFQRLLPNKDGGTSGVSYMMSSQPGAANKFYQIIKGESKPLELRLTYRSRYKHPSSAFELWQISLDLN